MFFIFLLLILVAFKSVSLQYLLHVDVLSDDSLVIVERPLDAILQSLPDPLHRKHFGV